VQGVRSIGVFTVTGEILALALAAPFIGSFLGTLVLRLPSGQPVVAGRSSCPQCGTVLRPWELVPIASWLVQRARCTHCHVAIPAFYPAIELGAVTVVAWAATSTSDDAFLLSCLLGWVLLALAVMDWRTLRLADALTLPLIVAGFGVAYLIDREHFLDHAIGAVAGLLLIVGLAAAYRAVRGRDGLGLGDAKLLAAGGAWVGWQGIGSILLVASLAALLAVAVQRLAEQPVERTTRIPLGAFLALGIWVVWLYGPITVGG
jgi:leader peptidase (prepilin peptidase) / N-methyltransferase